MKQLFKLIIFITLLLGPTVQAASPEKVSFDFDNAMLKEIIFAVAEYTGAGFVFDDSINTPISWTEKDIEKARIIPSFIRVVESSGYLVRALDSTNKLFAIKTNAHIQSNSTHSIGIHHLQNINAQAVFDAAQSLYGEKLSVGAFPLNNSLVISGSDSMVTDFSRIIKQIDKPKAGDIAQRRLKYIPVKSALQALTAAKISETESFYPDFWNRSVIIHGTPSQIASAEAILIAIDKPQEGWIDQLEYINSADIDLITELVSAAVGNIEVRKAGIDRLLISGNKPDVEKASSLIHQIDGTGLQVRVEAIIAYLNDEQFNELGVRLSYEGATESYKINDGIISSLITSNTGILAQWFTDFLGIQFAAEKGESQGRIISSPVITVLNNNEATIHVGQNVPYITKQNLNDDEEASSNSISRKDVGLSFKVLPQVQPNGEFIRLKIEQELSSLTDDSQLSSDTVDVVFDSQDIATTVLLADGDTIFLGGLRTEETGSTRNRIPLLGSIPYLGELFSYKKESTENRNLVVSLRVNVIGRG